MTSSPTFQTLCCELVEDQYGDFYRAIFETLTFTGRLTAPQVAQKCHLPLRQAKSGLASLIQLRLVNHHTAREATTIYSANLSNAYQSIRAGRLVEAAREQLGDLAAELLSIACQLGFATVAELRDRLLYSDSHSEPRDVRDVERIIQALSDDHFLIPLRRTHFQESFDAKRDIELSLMSPAALARLTGTKAKLEHSEAIDARYRQAVDTGHPEHGRVNAGYVSRPNGQHVNGDAKSSVNGHSIQSSTLIQPNYHKVVMLSQMLCVQDCTRKLHRKLASVVLPCIVRQVASPDVWSKQNDNYSTQLDIYQLRRDVIAQTARNSSSALTNGTSQANGYHHDISHQDEDEVHVDDIEKELRLLKEGAHDFISGIGSSWTVDKDSFDRWTKQQEILRVMDSRLDSPAPRIIRILIDKGMLEEKTLQEIGLLGAKELRQSLSKLKQMGYLDLQEIPRDPHRLPNKTVFLWNHDAGRVANLLVENIYTSILHLIQILILERKSVAGTLEKTEREDVKGNEEEMLAPAEFNVLSRFRRLEQWIWGEIHRLDCTIAVLRDL